MDHTPPESADDDDNLGFTYRTRKNGDVEILHHGRLASTLRGTKARDFTEEVEESDFAESQAIMARTQHRPR